jgi:predicted NUDIX family NTP pyrophosphohydrolase
LVILQTVELFAENPPPAPYVIRASDGGWHFDCGNRAGWSFDVPRRCRCGHCLPSFEVVRLAVWLPVKRARKTAAQRDRRFLRRLRKLSISP